MMQLDAKGHHEHTDGQHAVLEATFLPGVVSFAVFAPILMQAITIVGIVPGVILLLFSPCIYFGVRPLFVFRLFVFVFFFRFASLCWCVVSDSLLLNRPLLCCAQALANYNSRRLTLTKEAIIYKSGFFSCCCCCWSETTKTVPLEKIQDVELSQNWLQRCWGAFAAGFCCCVVAICCVVIVCCGRCMMLLCSCCCVRVTGLHQLAIQTAGSINPYRPVVCV